MADQTSALLFDRFLDPVVTPAVAQTIIAQEPNLIAKDRLAILREKANEGSLVLAAVNRADECEQ